MSATGYYRGHTIRYVGDAWRYAMTGLAVVDDPEPACGHCGKASTPEGHDGCLGTLPGVVNACCGHGTDAEAYVCLEDGRRLAGLEARRWMDRSADGRPSRT